MNIKCPGCWDIIGELPPMDAIIDKDYTRGDPVLPGVTWEDSGVERRKEWIEGQAEKWRYVDESAWFSLRVNCSCGAQFTQRYNILDDYRAGPDNPMTVGELRGLLTVYNDQYKIKLDSKGMTIYDENGQYEGRLFIDEQPEVCKN